MPPYTGQSPKPLRERPWWKLFTRDIKPHEIILFVIAALGALGFVNPIRRISSLEDRVAKTEQDIGFIVYLQCVQLRRSDPTLLPPACAPIIESRSGK